MVTFVGAPVGILTRHDLLPTSQLSKGATCLSLKTKDSTPAPSTPDRPSSRAPAPWCRRVHFSSTYAQDGIGGLRDGYEYGRGTNPTRDALQEQLAALEGGTHAYSFSSGLAAEDSPDPGPDRGRATTSSSATTPTAAPTA